MMYNQDQVKADHLMTLIDYLHTLKDITGFHVKTLHELSHLIIDGIYDGTDWEYTRYRLMSAVKELRAAPLESVNQDIARRLDNLVKTYLA